MAEGLVRLYDSQGEDAGVATRAEAEGRGLIIATVFTVIFDKKYRVWTSLRSYEKTTHPGKWDMTSRGCVDEEDETNRHAAQRELLEEAGLSTLLTSAGKMQHSFEENGGVVVRFPEVFFGVTEEIPQIQNEEVDGFMRLPIETLRTRFARHPHLYVPTILEEVELAFNTMQGGSHA